MRVSALDLFCCPACKGRLELKTAEQANSEVVQGEMACLRCQKRYSIVRRMPLLYVKDERWESKAREAEGWVLYHQNLNLYESSDMRIDTQLPYFPEEPWLSVARDFDLALNLANLSGQETVLDLGAGRGWAAKQFALKGCRVAAIDVVPDERVGLGRAWDLMEAAGVLYDPAIGDNENLPFFSETFDLVFCAAVLHHTSDLPALLKSVYRVLKPGGRLIAINEPCTNVHEIEQQVLQRDAAAELEVGINESRPNCVAYMKALKSAGFRAISISPPHAYNLNDRDLEAWAKALEAIPLYGRAWRLRKLRSWMRYSWQTCQAQIYLPRPRSHREQLIQAIIIHVSGGVIITAQK